MRVVLDTEVPMRNMCFAAALIACTAIGARAQTPEQSIDRALSQARQSGVPVELLESKIAEGRAKGVPMARIVAAVERRLQTLQRVQTTVQGVHALTTPEMGVAADALQAGVSESALLTIIGAAPGDRRAVAIATLTQLVQLGQASDVAVRNVTAALQRGPEALLSLPTQAAAAAARRGPPTGGPAGGGVAPQGRGGGPPPGVPAKPKPSNE
jgi:hypothetical protein